MWRDEAAMQRVVLARRSYTDGRGRGSPIYSLKQGRAGCALVGVRPPGEHIRLYDSFDDEGRAWLDEFVRAVDEGAYNEAVRAFLADEAEAPGSIEA